MAEKASIIKSLNDISQKIKAMSKGAEFTFHAEPSQMKNLQSQINQQEKERLEYLRSRISDFFEPVTQDIENDEEDLLKAYKLFCQLFELNKTAGDKTTHLKSFLLTSPICRKPEYTAAYPSENFSLLRLWFIANNPQSSFVPELVELENAPGTFALDFIDIDMWQYTSFEKEMINMVL